MERWIKEEMKTGKKENYTSRSLDNRLPLIFLLNTLEI